MKHPLKGKPIFAYFIAWLIVVAIHTVVIHVYYGLPLTTGLFDALIFNLPLAALAYSYWNVVQYVTPEGQGFTGVILSHVIGILITSMLVVYGAKTLALAFFKGDEVYSQFIAASFLWRLIVTAFLLTVVVLVYYLLTYNSDLREKEKDEIELQGMLRHSELEMLKFQINPHFIFNSLNSVSSLTITDPERARDMVIKLSDFLRASLGNQSPEEHTLRDEIAQMKLYLEIEKVRFGERLSIVHEVDDHCLQMTMPNMILQPLYENAIKYGIYEQLENVEIYTRCTCEASHLLISISNNYDPKAVIQKGKGIGLQNVNNRLELTYGLSGLMTIEKQTDNFTVNLKIPQS